MTDIDQSTWEKYAQDFNLYLNRTDIRSRIQELLNQSKTRFPLNLDHLRQSYPNLVPVLLSHPLQCLKALETTLQTIIEDMSDESNTKKRQGNVMYRKPHYTFAFEGTFGKNHVTPRGLNAYSIHNLVAVNGIVTRMSIVRPKLLQSVHYCDTTKVGHVKEYYDQYNLVADKTLQKESNTFPKKDKDDNPLTTEYGFCKYKDHQVLLVQEMPERAPTGMMPHSVEVILEEDLVDKVKPGDRVQVTGIYKAIVGHNTSLNAMFKGVLIATNIHVLSTEVDTPLVSAEDVRNIRKLAERKDIFDLLSRSVAPSIYGHSYIKKAILLMLLGGTEKVLESKTHLRGDINILMIGDPSTAKSQLLRRVLSIAPLAINTTGRGSSGVGLTAAVTYDKDTGEKHLEAGAMVLADRGIVCIDEFDKMEEADRVAIHEVMEQQTVTIAKAGIHTTLNARCSVIAAANPIYGEYQKDLPPTKNIGLPDSLLSRFDFIFIVLDEKNSGLDRMIAERVTKNHRYMAPGHEDTMGMYDHNDEYVIEPELNDRNDNEMFEKYNSVIHDADQGELLTQRFLKKYIFFAKKTILPVIKDEAIDFISSTWTQLRQRDVDESYARGPRTMTITIRTLETLIRIATAHAKMRLSKEVELIDCQVAKELLNFALFNEENDDNDNNSDHGNNGEEEMTIVSRKEDAEQGRDRQARADRRAAEREGTAKKSEKKTMEVEERLTRGKQQQQQQDSGLTKASSKKEDESKQKKVKKATTGKDADEVNNMLDNMIIDDLDVSEEAIRFVFKEFNTLLGGRAQIAEAELWNGIKKNIANESESVKKSLERKEAMVKIIKILDERNKVMYESDKKTILAL